MADTLTDAVVDLIAQAVLGGTITPPTLQAMLYTNSVTWSAATVASDLTECAAPGYARQSLSHSGWSGSTSSGVADYSHATVTFNLTGPGSPAETIEGYAIIDSTSGDVLWGGPLATPFVIPSGGGVVQLTPSWGDEECP